MGKWGFLLNRYIVTFGSIAIVTALWNLYISFNDAGIIEGRVVGPSGQPVAGAEVVLSERTLLVTDARARTTTKDDGSFSFSGHKFYRVWLKAAKPNVGAAPQKEYRLYFRGENLYLRDPIRLQAGAT